MTKHHAPSADSAPQAAPDPDAPPTVRERIMAVFAKHRAAVADHPTLDLARKNFALSTLDALLADLTHSP